MTSVLAPPYSLLAAQAGSLAEHRARLGPLPDRSAADLVALVGAAGLDGRGGAGFPTAVKLTAVARGVRPVVVANGAEGEPASAKDALLMARAPHLVLDGLELAARAVGATDLYVYAPDAVLRTVIEPALAERRGGPRVRCVVAPDTFVAGQESAVCAAVEGRPARPSGAGHLVVRRGVHGRATLVQNVETLAHLAMTARTGVETFRDRGTRLHTVSGAVAAPGVYEVPVGTTLGALVATAGGTSGPVHALLVGGYHGGWVPWSAATAELPLTREALAPFDSGPGAGVVVALAEGRCGLRAAADVAAYLGGQNAGQCGPCRNGLPTLAGHLAALAAGRAPAPVVHEIHRVAGLVDGRGACHHPAGTVRMVRSALRTFTDDVGHHVVGRCAQTGGAA